MLLSVSRRKCKFLFNILFLLTSSFIVIAESRQNCDNEFFFKSKSANRLGIPLLSKTDNVSSKIHDDDSSMPMEASVSRALKQPLAKTVPNNFARGGDAGSKLANLKERTVPAVGMLLGLFLLIKSFREIGLIGLVLLVQIGLFHEGTNVVVQPYSSTQKMSTSKKIFKWWWFLCYTMAVNVPKILACDQIKVIQNLPACLNPSLINLISYLMIVMGILSLIIQLNDPMSYSYDFQVAISDFSSYQMSVLLLLLPSSFWILTLQQYGMKWVLYPAYLVMINDTMAYIFGIIFGKNPLLPTISPKKTWEGFIGALFSTIGFSMVLWNSMSMDSSLQYLYHGVVIASFISLIAPFGGFLASIIKRSYFKKDFGNWIAGHGGFVDRLDCQIFTAPFIYLYLSHFIKQS